VKHGWERKKVGEIATHTLGKMLDKAKNRGELKPYLRNLNVRWFGFELSDVLEMRFLPEEEARYTAVKGDVLVCEGGYPGRAAIWERDEPIFFQKALHRVRFHEPERAKWFLYFLLAKDLDGTLKNYFNGAGIQHFTGEALARFEVPLPPLAEQQRIVAILDDALADIAITRTNAEKARQGAREFFESHLASLLSAPGDGWSARRLTELAHEQCSLSYGIVQPGGEYEGGLPVVRPTDLGRKVIRRHGLKRVDPAVAQAYQRTALVGGELLLCVRGDTGVVSIADAELAGANVTRGIVPIRFDEARMTQPFGYYALVSQPVQSQIRAKTYGAALMQINIRDLREIVLPVPPLAEQKRISMQMDSIEAAVQRLETLYLRKLAALDELRRSLLHRAFSGQL
jgi:type I restriction enzyme S subunit